MGCSNSLLRENHITLSYKPFEDISLENIENISLQDLMSTSTSQIVFSRWENDENQNKTLNDSELEEDGNGEDNDGVCNDIEAGDGGLHGGSSGMNDETGDDVVQAGGSQWPEC